MVQKKISRIFFLTLIIFLVEGASQLVAGLEFDEKKHLSVYLTRKQALEVAFPGADKVDREKINLTDGQRKAIGKAFGFPIKDRRARFYVGKKNGKIMGYMIIGHQIGKNLPITFMTVINPDGTVRDIEVMVYREPEGWEVRFESFLRQFFGRDSTSDFREINSITGATLSVRSITVGVQKALIMYKVLYLDKVQ
ncbi:MAG: FMN-binding protein [Nitrospinales bacterium]